MTFTDCLISILETYAGCCTLLVTFCLIVKLFPSKRKRTN